MWEKGLEKSVNKESDLMFDRFTVKRLCPLTRYNMWYNINENNVISIF